MDTVLPVDADWNEDFQAWLEPFLAVFKRSEQRYWAPLYLQGLIGPGARKSVEPMAERVCPGQTQQLHHFVSTSPWSTAPLEQVLRQTADALVGGKDAVLIVDDTALPKQGKHSVGVKRQHCGVLGKQAGCLASRRGAWQAGELPGARLAHFGAKGGASTDCLAAVLAQRLGAGQSASCTSQGTRVDRV